MSEIIQLFILEIGVVLFVSMLLGAIFAKLKQSAIVGYLLGGILLGPSMLGFVQQSEIISLFSELGVVLLLFYIGLELDTRKIKQGGFSAFILGPAKIVICFVLGYAVAYLLGLSSLEAIIVGMVTAISSTAIIGKYLLDHKLMHNLEANIAIPMLLIEDFVAVIALALLASYGSEGSISTIVLNGMLFVVVALFVIGRYSKYFMKLMEKLDYERHIALYGVGIALGLAFIANFFGLGLAIGAFLGGFLLSEMKYADKIRNELRTFRDFFLVFFFVSMGLVFTLPATAADFGFMLVVVFAILIVCIIGKFLSYGIGGTILGLDFDFSIYLSSLMTPVGEFSLIIAGTAVALGLPFATQIVSWAILLTIVSTFVMPFLIRGSVKISAGLRRTIPQFFQQGMLNLQALFVPFTQAASHDAEAQDFFYSALKSIGINLFSIFALVYLLVFASLTITIELVAGIPNTYIFAIGGLVLMLPTVIWIRKEISLLASNVTGEFSHQLLPDFNEAELKAMQQSTANFLTGIGMLSITVPLFLITYFMHTIYYLIPAIFLLIGLFYFLSGMLKARKEAHKIRAKKSDILNKIYGMRIRP